MITKWDMERYIEKYPDKFPYIYKKEENALYKKEDGSYSCSLDEFLEVYRKNSGESFESIYYEHCFLQNVLRCTECGTVIFTTEDEDYDPRLKCPICTDYHTYFEYWTKEDIESDEEKQKEIKFLEEMTEYKKERDERIKRRNGKHDWEIAIKKFYGKKIFLMLTLECDDITKSYFKGLRLKVDFGKKEYKDDVSYTVNKFFTIPLSWSQLRFQIMYKFKYKKDLGL